MKKASRVGYEVRTKIGNKLLMVCGHDWFETKEEAKEYIESALQEQSDWGFGNTILTEENLIIVEATIEGVQLKGGK